MQDYVILNPQVSSQTLEALLRAINLCQLKPHPISLEHGGKELGQEMIPDAFLPKDEALVANPKGVELADPVGVESGLPLMFLRQAPPSLQSTLTLLRWALSSLRRISMPPVPDFAFLLLSS